MTQPDLAEYTQVQTPVSDSDLKELEKDTEKAHIYVSDPSKAPPGVQLTKGPRGGLWFDSASVPKRSGYKPTKLPKQPKGKAPKAAKEEKPEKRAIGAPIRGPEDLPPNVQRESPEVQAAYTKAFNDVLAQGGAEADALAYAKQVLPDRKGIGKEPKPEKRAVGQPFNSFDDPSIPLKVRQEAEDVKRDWVLTFNVELKKGGSEADAIQAANERLPDRKKPKPVKAPRTSIPKTEESKKGFVFVSKWDESTQLRDDHGKFAGTSGGSGGGAAGGAGKSEAEDSSMYPPLDVPDDVPVVAHGDLYHGTRESDLSSAMVHAKEERLLYMTDNASEAAEYAKGAHLGGTGDGAPTVYRLSTVPGKTLNISAYVDEALMQDFNMDAVIDHAGKVAGEKGVHYLSFSHPSFVHGGEQNVIVSVKPWSDLGVPSRGTPVSIMRTKSAIRFITKEFRNGS